MNAKYKNDNIFAQKRDESIFGVIEQALEKLEAKKGITDRIIITKMIRKILELRASGISYKDIYGTIAQNADLRIGFATFRAYVKLAKAEIKKNESVFADDTNERPAIKAGNRGF